MRVIGNRVFVGFAVLAAVAVAMTWDASPAKAKEGWLTSYQRALEAAKKSDKVVLMDFSGSDWCIWCTRLKQEVFDSPEFKKWADRNAVLLELDFPRRKELPAALAKQNRELAGKFGVRGFPTVVFADVTGRAIGRSGYRRGGAEAWVKHAQAILDSRPKLKLYKSLVSGLARAKKENLPLLLIVTGAQSEKQIEPLTQDVGFIKYANTRLATVHVKPGRRGAEDARVLAALRKKHGLEAAPLRIALFDVAADKLLYTTTSAEEPAKLIEQFENVLPPIPYDGGWVQDYDRAKLIAAQRGRPMLLHFTGSDWCVWCGRLNGEIFSTDAFKNYAKEHLVLVKLDFPRKKELPPAVQMRNETLARKHRIRGFPTLIVLDAKEARLGQMGYMRGGPEPFLDKLKQLLKSPG